MGDPSAHQRLRFSSRSARTWTTCSSCSLDSFLSSLENLLSSSPVSIFSRNSWAESYCSCCNGSERDKGLVYVLWEERQIALFAVDVAARGIEIRDADNQYQSRNIATA